jgi:hypothetical protein
LILSDGMKTGKTDTAGRMKIGTATANREPMTESADSFAECVR